MRHESWFETRAWLNIEWESYSQACAAPGYNTTDKCLSSDLSSPRHTELVLRFTPVQSPSQYANHSFLRVVQLVPDPPFAHLFTTPKTDIFATFVATLRTFSVKMQLRWATLTPESRRSLDRLFLPSPAILLLFKDSWAPETAALCSQLVNYRYWDAGRVFAILYVYNFTPSIYLFLHWLTYYCKTLVGASLLAQNRIYSFYNLS